MLPNLVIIGAMKCGTTSLHYYLDLHPEISMSKQKELRFFVEGGNWKRGLDWYRDQFRGEARIHGEASPAYTAYPRVQGVPERMVEVIPDAKLIYIVRHPVDRMVSHYVHRYAAGMEDRPLVEALGSDDGPYLNASRYAMQLQRYLPHYPMDRILVLTQEDLHRDQQGTLRKVLRFLDVEVELTSPWLRRRRHPSGNKRRLSRVGRRVSACVRALKLDAVSPEAGYWAEHLATMPFSRRIERPRLDEAQSAELMRRLRDDITELESTTGQSFGW